MTVQFKLLLFTLLSCAACSSVPEAGDLASPDFDQLLKVKAERCDSQLAIAPVAIRVSNANGQEDFVKSKAMDLRAMQQSLRQWITKSQQFREVTALPLTRNAQYDDSAWSSRADLILEVTLSRLDVRFLDHNGLWIPNMVIWAYAMFPSWWIATDSYELELEADVKVRLVDSEKAIFKSKVSAKGQGRFDEFDRGWRWFGIAAILGPGFNAKGNWLRISQQLFPSVSSQLAKSVSVSLNKDLRRVITAPTFPEQSKRHFALVIGLSEYEDQEAMPIRPSATVGAKAVARQLKRLGSHRTAFQLFDAEATLDRFKRLINTDLKRIRENDELMIYFSGRTVSSSLLFHETDRRRKGRLRFKDLAKLLKPIPGRIHLFLEVSLSDLEGSAESLFQDFTRAGINVLCANKAGRSTRIPKDYDRGLFSHHLSAALSGKADSNADKQLSFQEIADYVVLRVESEAGFYQSLQQTPQAVVSSKRRTRG